MSNQNAFYIDSKVFLPRVENTLINLEPVAIGTQVYPTLQSNCGIAIGDHAGYYNQGECAIAVGTHSGQTNQGAFAVAMGADAGQFHQSTDAIAIGVTVGQVSQSFGAIAIGDEAGKVNQSTGAIAIGTRAGETNQGQSAIAIGAFAGASNQHAQTIVLNATGSTLNTNGTARTYIAPIRDAPIGDKLLTYNSNTNELLQTNTLTFDWTINGNLSVNGSISDIQDFTGYRYFPTKSSDISTLSGLSSQTRKWSGGVLAPNGKIYGIPRDASSVLVINPKTNTVDTTSIPVPAGLNKFVGGVLAPNGKIYCAPFDATYVLIIDPVSQTVDTTSIVGLPVTSGKWCGAVLAPNGNIYCIPHNSTTVLVINPNTNTTVTFVVSDTVGMDWAGGVVGTDGNVYGIPYNSNRVLIINTTFNVVDTTSISGLDGIGAQSWFGGVLASNGKIYGFPSNSTAVLVIDPSSTLVTLTGTFSTAAYVDTTRVLTCTGANFTTELAIGDNIVLTTTTTTVMGYVQTITSATQITFIYALGADYGAGTITNIQRTRKADLTTLSGIANTTNKYVGGVMSLSGPIYGIPWGSTNTAIVNPASAVTTLTGTYASATYNDATRILTCPGATFDTQLTVGDNVIVSVTPTTFVPLGYVQSIDSATQITLLQNLGTSYGVGTITNLQRTRLVDVTTVTGLVGANKWEGGVLSSQGNIYGIPADSTSSLILTTGLPVLPNWPLEPYFNKF